MKKIRSYIVAATLALCCGMPLHATDSLIENGDSSDKLIATVMESTKTSKASIKGNTNKTKEIIATTLDSILQANSKKTSNVDAETIRQIVTSAIDSVLQANDIFTKNQPAAPIATAEEIADNNDAAVLADTTAILVEAAEESQPVDAQEIAGEYLVETDATESTLTAPEGELTGMNKRHRNFLDKILNSTKIKVDTTQNLDFLYETVIVDKDTIPVVLPQKNYGRYDRGLYNFLFIPRKQWAFGLTASYGEFSSEDIQLFSLVSNIDVTLKGYSIKPSIAYFFRHNQSIGLRFDYTHIYGAIDNLYFEYDDDINFNLNGVSYNSNTYSMALFYRNYLGLSKNGRFSIFNEVAFNLGGGANEFVRNYAGIPKHTRTDTFSMSLDFSPGICVFIQEYVSFNVSFGVFGLHYKHEKQYTDGVYEGTRNTSGANFRFNLFNINFGIGIHI